MERQNRLITVLAVVLLVLVAIAIYGKDPDKKSDSDPHEPPDRKLFEVEKDDITTLSLKTAKGEVAFEKKDGSWEMTAPKSAPVEERKVTEIIDRLTTLEAQDRELKGAPEGYGLDVAQRAEVVMGTAAREGAAASTHRLFVGLDAPVGYRTYVAKEESGPTLLASSQIHDLANRGPDDFRSKELWKPSSSTARRIVIEEGDRKVTLRKDDHGWWIGDEGPRASDTAVNEWLSKANLLRASEFLDGADPATLGLDSPTATVTIEDATTMHRLKIGSRDEAGANAMGLEGPVRVEADALDIVRLDGWTETKLLPVRRAQVDAIEVRIGPTSARFTKKDDAWTDAEGKPVTTVEGILDAIDDASADRSSTAAPAPAEPGWGSIVLSEGTTRTESVVFGNEVLDGRRIARDKAGGPAFFVPEASLQAIEAALKGSPGSAD